MCTNTDPNHNNFNSYTTIKTIVLLDKRLTSTEKICYSMIASLTKITEYCYCSNNYLSKILDISSRQVSSIIQKLKDLNYIDIIIQNNTKRKIYLKYDNFDPKKIDSSKEIFNYNWLEDETDL